MVWSLKRGLFGSSTRSVAGSLFPLHPKYVLMMAALSLGSNSLVSSSNLWQMVVAVVESARKS